MTSANEGQGRRVRDEVGCVSRETPGNTPRPDQPSVSRETWDRLSALLGLVRRWNPVVNLVARGDLRSLEQRHLADSLRLLPLLPPDPGRAIDLGSGGGFPGLVLAIASGRPFDLIEADQRKAAFLSEAALQLAAPVRVVAHRIEEAGVPPVGLVTARALAPLPKLLSLAAPFLMDGGTCLFLKGRDAEAEIAAAAVEWVFTHDLVREGGPDAGAVLRVQGIARRAGAPPSRGKAR